MSNDLVSYDAQWGADAKQAASKEKLTGGGRFISHRAGVFSIGNDESRIEYEELCLVVLDDAYENTYFDKPFDAENIVPPKCWAIANNENELGPDDDVIQSSYFEAQNETCKGCDRNEWPKRGENKRKECRNMRRLLVLPAGEYTLRKGTRAELDLELFIDDDTPEDNQEYVTTGDVFMLKLPPTSLRGYKEVVHKMQKEYSRPPHGMILRCYTKPRSQGGHEVVFEPLGLVPDALYPHIMERREKELPTLLQGYREPEEEEPPF